MTNCDASVTGRPPPTRPELPDQPTQEEVEEFGDRHAISRDELVNRVGGSP